MCIYSCHYEYTSYNLVTYLCMSQWCDNENHDLPQHVRRLLKCRDDADEINEDQYLFPLSLSVIPFLCVLVIIFCFHYFYCMLIASEYRSTVTCKMGVFIAAVTHTVHIYLWSC